MAEEKILKDKPLNEEQLDQIAGGDALPTLQPNQQGYYPQQPNQQPNWNVPPAQKEMWRTLVISKKSPSASLGGFFR